MEGNHGNLNMEGNFSVEGNFDIEVSTADDNFVESDFNLEVPHRCRAQGLGAAM